VQESNRRAINTKASLGKGGVVIGSLLHHMHAAVKMAELVLMVNNTVSNHGLLLFLGLLKLGLIDVDGCHIVNANYKR